MQTAVLFPGLTFCLVFILNLFVWAQASSTAIPFGTLVGLVALWLLIQVPLVYVGSWFGYVRAAPWEHPTKTNSIPRQLPPQPWYLRSFHGTLLTGLIPFAVLFIELLFVFKNLWQDKSSYYYVFGFLSVVCTILIVTVSEVTIITTYSQLCAEVSTSTPLPVVVFTNYISCVELPLVVAELFHRRQQRILDFWLLHLVLLLQAPRVGICLESALLQLQLPRLRRVWSVDWDGWIPDCLRVCPADLQVSII